MLADLVFLLRGSHKEVWLRPTAFCKDTLVCDAIRDFEMQPASCWIASRLRDPCGAGLCPRILAPYRLGTGKTHVMHLTVAVGADFRGPDLPAVLAGAEARRPAGSTSTLCEGEASRMQRSRAHDPYTPRLTETGRRQAPAGLFLPGQHQSSGVLTCIAISNVTAAKAHVHATIPSSCTTQLPL